MLTLHTLLLVRQIVFPDLEYLNKIMLTQLQASMVLDLFLTDSLLLQSSWKASSLLVFRSLVFDNGLQEQCPLPLSLQLELVLVFT